MYISDYLLATYTGASEVIAGFCEIVGKGVAVQAATTSLDVSVPGKYGATPLPTGAAGGSEQTC